MSAVVCGSKRSFFEDIPSPSASKRIRCSSSSPVRFSSPSLVDQLRAVFPHMETQFLEKALEECGGDIDSAIKRLHELCLGSTNESGSAGEVDKNAVKAAGAGASTNDANVSATSAEVPSVQNNLPADGAEWVELFVREMMSATSVDNARDRAARVLEILEKSISSHAGAEVAQSFQKENMMLKEQIEVLIRENTILKRAVSIQHERQKEFEDKNQELHQLKQMVSQYQEQIRSLEVNNYALTMHLRQAQQSSSMPGRFHPDIF